MPQLAILLMAVIIGILLFIFLKKTKGMESITYDLTHDDPPPKADTSDLISTAQNADEALVHRAEENKAAIEQITAETEIITEYRKPAEPVSVDEVIAETEEDSDAIKTE
jgi:hypothetical protein